ERGAGATPGHEERSTPERSPSQSALAAAPPTPMSQTLGELQLPPVPELLETERQFAAAGVDPLWSEGMEGHILGEISQLTGLELVGLQVECKTTLCRLFRSDPCA
ncbi:MAG TPA: hypothetical protein VFB99_23875, partial [Vicinamibacterales bacterium]|nr:hypothetical protein [Vicinamibacterales bacterium]